MKSLPTGMCGRTVARICDVWAAHPECALPVGTSGPVIQVVNGDTCLIMVAKGPLMVFRYLPTLRVQFLLDAYGYE